MAERDPGTGGGSTWSEVLRALRWPLIVLIVAGMVAIAVRELRQTAREGGRAAADAVRAAADGAAEVASRFATGTITTTFRAALPRLVPDGGAKLELAAYEAVETISRTDDRRVFFDLVPLGATVSEIRVPVTYRYHLRLDEPWRLSVSDGTCVVHAPPIRATLPPAIHTHRMEKRSESGWLRFDEAEQMAALERSLTPTLSQWAQDRKHVELVRDTCRRRVADFVRSWLLLEDQWGRGRFTGVEVIFADEAAPAPAAMPPEIADAPQG